MNMKGGTVMAIELVKNPQHYQGTAAERAAQTATEKLEITAGSTFWETDAKLLYTFTAGDWAVVS